MDIQERLKKIEAEIDDLSERDDLSDDQQIRLDGLTMQQRTLAEALALPAKTIGLSATGGEVAERVMPYGRVGIDYRELFYGDKTASVPVGEKAEEFMRRAIATRTMLAGTMGAGGAMVPEYWFSDVYRDAFQISVALPRVRVYQMKSGELHIPAMDSENQQDGYMGGVSASWQAENATATEVTPKTRMVNLVAKKLSMYLSMSREVAEDAVGNIAGLVGQQMAYAVQQGADEVILTGDGVGKPLGVLHAPCRVDYPRAAPSAISFADVAGMYGRLHPAFVRGACWVGHPSVIPMLLTMTDAGSNAIWRPAMGATEGVPGMPLLGLPVFLSDKLPALGTAGDLMLCNFGQYALGIRQGATLESTNAAHWLNDLMSFRVVMRLDGKPLADSPITPRTGGSTLSAFVVLN